MDNGPINEEVVAEEVMGALEAQGEDGDSELGTYKVRLSSKNPCRIILSMFDADGNRVKYSLTVKRLK